MNNPLISIIIPAYNAFAYIKDAIDSALNQTYKNIEIIVVNDGSTDNGLTRDVCLSYGDKIKYFEKENGGVSTALNYGIKKMSGEYFSWLSHDDRYLPNKIEENVKIIEKSKNSLVIPFSDYAYIDKNGKKIKITHVKEKGYHSGIYSVLMGNINGLSLLIHKSLLDEIGGFDEKLKTIQDYDCFFKLALNNEFIHTNLVLVETRIHNAQQGTQKYKMHIKQSDEFFKKCIEAINDKQISEDKIKVIKAWYNIAYRYKRNQYKNAFIIALERAKAVDVNIIIKLYYSLIFFIKCNIIYPLWIVFFKCYKYVRKL